jgi:CBS domain-containing protein
MKMSQDLSDLTMDKVQFLRNVEPFRTLESPSLEDFSAFMNWREFPPRTRIISQGIDGTDFYMIKSGLVKVFLNEGGNETILAFLGEGDCFGEMSLLSGHQTNASVEAVEPVVCLVQSSHDFVAMAQEHPTFQRFFSQLFGRRMKTVYRELLAEKPGVSQVEPFLFRKTVGEMVSSDQVFCLPWETIQKSTEKMLEKGVRSVMVVNDLLNPLGVLTLDSILRALIMEGKGPGTRVDEVMEKQFKQIGVQHYFFDALHEMVAGSTDTLIAMEGTKARGLLTGFDLLRFRGREVLFLSRNIESASELSQLRTATLEIGGVLRTLMADGALASQACHVVSELNNRVVRQIIRLVEAECGPPPCPYVWLALGSEGRREQTLLTDQDNAIVFTDDSFECVTYFTRFSKAVVDALSACGFSRCEGDVMAINPMYFGTIREWKERVETWARDIVSEDKNGMNILVFLDFRLSWGDPWLENILRSHVLETVKRNPGFLPALGRLVVDTPVPLGFFRDFVVEEAGTYRDKIDLKVDGLVPLVTCIKLLSWQQGIPHTNTLRRIRGLESVGTLSGELGDFLEQAFETFLTLKLRANLNDVEQGRTPGNHIDLPSLSTRQKQLLREAFLAVWHLEKATRKELGVEVGVSEPPTS